MIKILYLINTLKEAGAQKHLIEVINGLDKSKFEPWLGLLSGKPTERIEGIPVVSLGVKRIYGITGIKGLYKLINLIRKEKFDVVHSYLFTENILGSIAAKFCNVPIIITSRRDTGLLYNKRIHYIWAYRLTNLVVDKIVCVSKAVRKAVAIKEKVGPYKLEVIYNGIDVNKYNVPIPKSVVHRNSLGIRDGEFVVGIIANFSWIKGHKYFIEAAQFVLAEVPNVKFLLVGDGSEKQRIADSVERLGLKNRVLFLGVRKDVPELLSIIDISVNASYSEGMSNTVLQSMASGVPVVATAVDGNLETVVDGVTGILVHPKNPKAMSEAIIRILKDRALARMLGENARKDVEEKFTLQIMLGNMESLYKRLLKPKIAFIFSQFPCYDETFILREMNKLKNEGLNFVIYSIKPCGDKIIHQEAEELSKSTYYLTLFSLKLFLINLFFALRHPFRYWSTFLQIFFNNLKSRNFFVKSIGLWIQAVGFAWLARRDKVYHVHGQWATFPATDAFIISRLNNIPFSFTGHAHDIFVDTAGLKQKIKGAKFVVTCTEYNKKYLVNLVGGLKEKIIVNYHGVDIDKFNNRGTQLPSAPVSSKFRILSVGSLLECKGFDILIEACKILGDTGIDFECTIAGGGPLEKNLKSQVANLKLEERIKFTGYITQNRLIPLYQQADVFALPMRSKIHWGIPNVLLEAMTAKVPVVCTHLPSIPELIENDKTGFIIPEEEPQILAETLVKIYKEEHMRKDIGNAGYEIIRERFNINKTSQNLINLFKSQLEDIKALNILYIIPSLELGGAERVVINLAKGLDKERFNPVVCCLNEKGRFAEELEKEGIKVIALNKKGPFDLGIISKLVRVMRENRIDVVNTHLWGANFWGRIAAKIAKVKVIIATEHNTDVWKNRFHFVCDRWLSRKTDKIIAVSNSVKEFYVSKGIAPDKIEVVYNGIELCSSRVSGLAGSQVKEGFGIKENEKVLAVIGRLVPQKGHRYLFEALHQLDGRYNVKLLVVGDGPLRKELELSAISYQLSAKVVFTGIRRDIKDILGITDILVMPSTREGLPMVALEAMAAGVPIVAAKVGGVPELVVDGQTGILVEPENIDALKDALIRIIEDKSFARQLGDNAKKRVEEEFSLEKMLNKTQEVFEGCSARMQISTDKFV